jgi:hypothetical protein
MIGRVHPEEVKLTHWFPAAFTAGTAALPILYFAGGFLFHIGVALLALYLLLIFLHALKTNRHLGVAALSVAAALLQLWGYGIGFLAEKVRQKRAGLLIVH